MVAIQAAAAARPLPDGGEPDQPAPSTPALLPEIRADTAACEARVRAAEQAAKDAEDAVLDAAGTARFDPEFLQTAEFDGQLAALNQAATAPATASSEPADTSMADPAAARRPSPARPVRGRAAVTGSHGAARDKNGAIVEPGARSRSGSRGRP